MRIRPLLATALLALAATVAVAAPPAFVPDPAVQAAAEADAEQAVATARRQFGVALDYSDRSIEDVERALAGLHTSYSLASPKPPDEQLMPLAGLLGAYVGEVYRRNHGGAWGQVTMNGRTYPGIHTAAGVDVWPAGRVMNRITDGPENDVAAFYRRLAEPRRDGGDE
jgi:hypothetical protein